VAGAPSGVERRTFRRRAHACYGVFDAATKGGNVALLLRHVHHDACGHGFYGLGFWIPCGGHDVQLANLRPLVQNQRESAMLAYSSIAHAG